MKKPDVRAVLMNWAECIPESEVAILLSAGIDSTSLLFALLESGKKVTAYSFMLDGKVSTDFSLARKNAKTFGCEFVPVFLPLDIEVLIEDLRRLKQLGAQKKTDFECGWPMLYAYAAVKEYVVASGMGADGHFCISKKGMLHFRDKIDEFRLNLYNSRSYAQRPIHEAIAAQLNKRPELPYLSQEMKEQFLGTSWAQVNKPKQKQPIIDAFADSFQRLKILPHTNLQLGDSGIAQHFESLLKSRLNTEGHKSVVSIYNRLK